MLNPETLLAAAGYEPCEGYRLLANLPKEKSSVPIILICDEIIIQREQLVERYGRDAEIHVLYEGEVRSISVVDFDVAEALILPPERANMYEARRLTEIMSSLRSRDGCPWDRQQTHRSLRRYLIEEAYEVAEAIDNADDELLCEELGDVLLQVVFHSRIAEERGKFDFSEVAKGISDKMVYRHPHVFDKDRKIGAEEVIEGWEERKKDEKNRKNVLEGMYKGLPSLVFACKIQEKTARVGFDWSSIEPVWEKLWEEWQEVREAITEGDEEHIEEECGDVLFATVNLLRHLGVEPETALRRTNEKFYRRFNFVERQMRADGLNWNDVDLRQMDAYWIEAKRRESDNKSDDSASE